MRLQDNPYYPDRDLPSLVRQLDTIYRQIATQVNALSEGRIAGAYAADTAAPTAGPHVQGDTVRNLAPVEAGTAGSMYVVLGWVCVASGTPGTWVETRALTGN